MNSWWSMLPVLIVCYLIGSVPFGVIVARLKGIDITQHGSRNIGATNVGRVLGKRYGVMVFLLDFCKGFIPVLLVGSLLEFDEDRAGPAHLVAWLSAAFCCFAGHVYSIYLGFKGGKGVATALGATMGIYPDLTVPTLICFAVWLLMLAISRLVSLSSLAGILAFPIAVYFMLRPIDIHEHWPVVLYALLVPGIAIQRHRSNISRLLHGTERGMERNSGTECDSSEP